MSLSNIRSLPLNTNRIIIGDEIIDLAVEQAIADKIQESYPGLDIATTPIGKKVIPLREFASLEREWQDRVKDVYQKRFNEGYSEGLKKGREEGHKGGLSEGQKEASNVIEKFSGLIKDVTEQRRQLLNESRENIFDIILKIAEKLTFASARIDPQITLSIINGALDQLLDKKKLKIKVHPDHLSAIEQQIEKFGSDATTVKEITIEADPRVREGGCFIETPTGDVDARLESMFDVIKQSILESGDDSR